LVNEPYRYRKIKPEKKFIGTPIELQAQYQKSLADKRAVPSADARFVVL
jgi:hypothetical protein